MTAGGAQALLKGQRVAPGQRVLMVGSGPLVLAFAVELHQLGANVVAVCEAAPRPGLGATTGLLRAAGLAQLDLIRRGVSYHAYLRRHRIPFLSAHIVTSAKGERQVESVSVAPLDQDGRPSTTGQREFDVDTLCLGYGLVPSTELAMQRGCGHVYVEELGGYVPVRDETLRSSVPSLYVAGDGAGINGVAAAICEGRIAGISAAAAANGSPGPGAALASRLRTEQRRREALRQFNEALHGLYPVANGLHELLTPETVVCRCEGVTAEAIARGGRPGRARLQRDKEHHPRRHGALSRAQLLPSDPTHPCATEWSRDRRDRPL